MISFELKKITDAETNTETDRETISTDTETVEKILDFLYQKLNLSCPMESEEST